MQNAGAASWDAEYLKGRYREEPPVPFVADILAAARNAGFSRGLYIGCGNGRNYVPLTEAGLDLIGLDISEVAIKQLGDRLPERRDRLVVGDMSALPADERYPLVVGIQVFQHGDRAAAHEEIRRAQALLEPGGLLAVRVNSTLTDLWPDHVTVEEAKAGSGTTIRYLAGPKEGLLIHFFDQNELELLFTDRFDQVVPLRQVEMWRTPPKPGAWVQHEVVWQLR